MGADLFGSFAESTCAALVVSSTQMRVLVDGAPTLDLGMLMYPLVVSAFGIGACFLVSAYAVFIQKVNHINKIESTLKFQLVLSTVVLTPTIIAMAYWAIPKEFIMLPSLDVKNPAHAFVCSLMGCNLLITIN